MGNNMFSNMFSNMFQFFLMGGKQGKEVPAPTPPPPPMRDVPWRDINWENNDKLLKELKEFKPAKKEMQHLRFLLYSPVAAGKSSFINSVTTTLLGRMAIPAAVNTREADETSFTVEYNTHRIIKDQGSLEAYFPFVFNDTMGLECEQNQGVRTEDIKLAMMGHVKDGYKFNPMSSISETDPFYNAEPSLDDRVHVVACVLDVNSPDITPLVLQKIKEVRQAARDLGISHIAIGTHIDELCEEIEKDVCNVYKSKALENKMTEISIATGIPLQCIMAVKNYCNGNTQTDKKMDTLILTVLRHMVDFGNDFIKKIP